MRTPGGRSDRSNQQKKRTDSNRARPGGRAQSPDGAPQQARPAGRPERGIRKKSEREAGKHRPKPRNRPAGDANRDADARGLLFGRRPVQAYTDVLAEPSPDAAKHSDVEAIYLSESFPKKLRDALLRKLPTVPFQELPRRELDQMYPDIHHQGVILRFRAGTRPGNQADELDWRTFVQERSGLLLLLDRIQDPQNLGSILRSAEALGVRAVFMTGQGAPLGDTAHRVSSGASLRLPIFHQTNLHRLVEYLKACEYWICSAADPTAAGDSKGATGRSGAAPLALEHHRPGDLPPAGELALVIGNEGEGVKPLVLSQSDYILSIPLRGKTESLNAGVAAGILIDRLIHR